MRYIAEKDICDFDSWSCDTLEKVRRAMKCDELEELANEVFGGKLPTATEVNDWLRFDKEWIYEALGLNEDGELPDEGDAVEAAVKRVTASICGGGE